MGESPANKKFLIWGTGNTAEACFQSYSFIQTLHCYEIIGFATNTRRKWGTEFHGRPVFPPDRLREINYDGISVWSKFHKEEILRQMRTELRIPEEKIQDIFGPIREKLCLKYAGSADAEILDTLRRVEERPDLTHFYFRPPEPEELPPGLDFRSHEVFFDDSCGLRFVLFEGKRLYLARSYNLFFSENGKICTGNFWAEQQPHSPHIYESPAVKVENGDVLVDAGACEGNFSLHHIDRVKRVYLIECQEDWMEALRHTFAPYREKVVFLPAFLGEGDTERTACLDSLIPEPVDFLKMDIEGAERSALRGGTRLLSQNPGMKCSICAYHRHGDEAAIREILTERGFSTEVSTGYMLFLLDEEVQRDPEFRRGIVRGVKR